MRKYAALLSLLLCLLLALSACGGADTQKSQEEPTQAPSSEDAAEPAEEETEPATEAAEPAAETAEPATEAAEPASEAEAAPQSGDDAAQTAEEVPQEGPDDAPQVQQAQEGPDDAPEAAAVQQSGDPGDPLAYTVSRNKDGNIEYMFDVLLVTVPGDWEGKYFIKRESDHVNFYHAASMMAFLENYDFGGGFMFGISLEERGVDPEYPSEQYLGLARGGKDYYMIFPTDVQGYYEDEEIYKEWVEMNAEMELVQNNSYSMLFHD